MRLDTEHRLPRAVWGPRSSGQENAHPIRTMTQQQTSISRRNMLAGLGGLAGTSLRSAQAGHYQIGAYYFPGWHADPRNENAHGKGWTEWELLKRAEPRFPGHQQPKRPLWGYQDESDPRAFEKKISAAAGHGITHLIFDWYWYEGRPFLHRALENGYWNALNNSRLKFCLMWANPSSSMNRRFLQF